MTNAHNPLSANTLFHFTKDMDTLLKILKFGYKPNYCIEDYYKFGLKEFAIPMVCFCDIPLSQIRNHVGTYGKYAIGISKEWGITKGITPILYAHGNSQSTAHLNSDLLSYNRTDDDLSVEFSKEYKVLDANGHAVVSNEILKQRNIFHSYTKPYQGRFWRKGHYLEEEVRFYDEREWRYVPDFNLMRNSHVENVIPKAVYLSNPENFNSKLERFKLDFVPSDIRYIIVESEKEVIQIANDLDQIKENYSKIEKQIVKTRVLSLERILEDF